MNCISCSMVRKIIFCTEFLDIPDEAGRVTRRRRTQAITKRFAFHENVKREIIINEFINLRYCHCRVLKIVDRRTFLS